MSVEKWYDLKTTNVPLSVYRGFYANPGLCSRCRDVGLVRLWLAFRAQSPHSQAVMRRPEPKVYRHLILEIFYLGRKELDHSSALSADHVIVMLMIVMVLVVGLVVAKPDFACQSGLREQL